MSSSDDLPGDQQASIAELTAFSYTHHIQLKRSTANELLLRLAPINQGLTIGPLDTASQLVAFRIKSLISLWNFALDDDIDSAGSSDLLDASMDVIRRCTRQQPYRARHEGATAALAHALESLDDLAGPLAMQVMASDLWEHAIGFEYDHITNSNRNLLHSSSYSRFAILNASPKSYVTIDLALSGRPLRDRDFMMLRTACDSFAIAMKYASDIGSYSRDIRERTGNILWIRLVQSGHEGKEADSSDEPRLRPLLEQARTMVVEHFERGSSLLRSLPPQYETDQFITTVNDLIQHYLDRDYSVWS